MRKLIAIAVCICLVGCAQMPAFEVDKLKEGKDLPYIGVPEARRIVRGWTDQLRQASATRESAAIFLEELQFYGTIAMVVGLLTISSHGGVNSAPPSAVRDRNHGAIALATGSLLSSHYQAAQQSAAFDVAVRRMECAGQKLVSIDPAVYATISSADRRKAIRTSDSTLLVDAYGEIGNQTMDFIQNKVNADLYVALKTLRPTASNASDIKVALTAVTNAANASGDSPAARGVGGTDPAAAPNGSAPARYLADAKIQGSELQDRQHQLIVAVASYGANLVSCAALNAQ